MIHKSVQHLLLVIFSHLLINTFFDCLKDNELKNIVMRSKSWFIEVIVCRTHYYQPLYIEFLDSPTCCHSPSTKQFILSVTLQKEVCGLRVANKSNAWGMRFPLRKLVDFQLITKLYNLSVTCGWGPGVSVLPITLVSVN